MLSHSFLTRWLMFCIQLIRISLCVYSLHAITSDPLQIQFVSKFVFFSVSGCDSVCPTALITLWQKWHESSTDSFESLEKPRLFHFFPLTCCFCYCQSVLLACLVWICHKGLRVARSSVCYILRNLSTFFLLLFWLFIMQTACWKHWNASPLWHMQKQH